jgi:predicted dienelactone hydrolase
MRLWRGVIATVVFVIAAMLAPAGAAAAPPAPFGHACEPRPSGVLFCPTRTLADRVPSFDGTPIDVDVTLPGDAQAGEPLPTIVMLHGYGGNKRAFESETPEGSGSTTYHYNNTYYAQRGYAVVIRRRAASAARAGRRRARRRRRTASPARAMCTWPTSAGRRATPSTCSACWSTSR